MYVNMSTPDRIVRLAVVALVAALYAADAIGGALGLVLAGVALVSLLTSVVGFCPLYAALGLGTKGS